jgi:hypothetical protein
MRGGGLGGLIETVHIWSADGHAQGSYEQSDQRRSLSVRLPTRTLDSTLVLLESMVSSPPLLPPDTGLVRMICADAIERHIEVRHGNRIQSAQEECPHRTHVSEAYWLHVDSVFQLLAAAAR